jgi:hypothetical protein
VIIEISTTTQMSSQHVVTLVRKPEVNKLRDPTLISNSIDNQLRLPLCELIRKRVLNIIKSHSLIWVAFLFFITLKIIIMNIYDKIKENNLKQNELIDELKYAQQVENGEITHELKLEDVRSNYDNYHYAHLIDIKQGKIVCSGTRTRIHSYCRLRGINREQIKHTGYI